MAEKDVNRAIIPDDELQTRTKDQNLTVCNRGNSTLIWATETW